MARWMKAAACASLGIGVVLGSAAAAHAQSGTFQAGSTSAAPGSVITLRSVTPCTLPSGVQGSPLVRVGLSRDSQSLGSGESAVSSDGTWQASFTIDAGASPGPAQLHATCVASAQAEGALVDYEPVAFTVSGALPHTGASPTALVLGAGVCVTAGAALLLSARRPRRAR